jgi:hypothetical protein
MALIDDVIAAFELQDPEEKLSLWEISKKFGVVRLTLTRRVQGQTRLKEVKALQQQLLSLQQEIELCLYIEHLTKQELLPTRAII